MNNPQKLFCVLAVVVSQWPRAAAAQSPVGAPPPAQPYVWRAVAMGGGGFVDGIVFHPTAKNLMYARTDVGGAYRWDDASRQWIPLTDWLSPAQNNYTGIESIGLDPSDPNRLYLAAGTYSRNPAAILRSDDQGKTFEVTEVPFRMGGNEDGRSNGERLAVDPNDGTILFFGSRSAGLWKSSDHGVTWNAVASFPNTSTVQPRPVINAASTNSVSTNAPARGRRGGGFGGNQPIGIVSVVFDAASGHRGAPTPVIYAAVSTFGTNLFRSDDAGVNWQPVAGQPIGLRPSHLIRSVDGLFYISYGSMPGPGSVTDGALWKYNPKDGSWANISPEKPAEGQRLGWGYGAVSVDAQHPSTIVATTIDRWQLKDEIFRSTDGGATWKGIMVANGHLDYSMAPYTATGHTPHWTGSVAVNPKNPDQILFGTGYGIWASTNATAADSGGRVTWIFLDNGLEETVPLALVSPPTGAHLISGVGDIDGFRHDDVDVSPPDGTFAGPRFASTRDIVYAGAKPEVIVRIGNGGRGLAAHAAISENGGKTWKTLARDCPGGNGGQGKLAISADGNAIIWSPQRGPTYVTYSQGTTWINCQGLASGARITADPVNPSRFYSFDGETGKLLASTNAATTFEVTAAELPTVQGGGRGGGAGVLAATTGIEGDLWFGSRAEGLFHSTDGGVSFTKIASVSGADALGFGMAAPEKTFPAVFLLGNINNLHARYRSDDAGQTWVRIDDDQHQYASANVPLIIGDPRIYGRVYFTTGGRGVIYGDINRGLVFGKK
jgi:photosystem II stability/assembly factor-like uncharacterized protein